SAGAARGGLGLRQNAEGRGGVDHAVLDPAPRPRAGRRRDRAAEPGAVAGRREGHGGRVGARPPGQRARPGTCRAPDWLLAVGDIQRFGRRVARFFTGFDAFLTPTMSAPPLPIGTMVSTPDDPWRSLQARWPTVRYAGSVCNLTGH